MKSEIKSMIAPNSLNVMKHSRFYAYLEIATYSLVAVISLWWLYSAITFAGSGGNTTLPVALTLFIFAILLLSETIRNFIIKFLRLVLRYKWVLFVAMLVWQLLTWSSFGNVTMGADQEMIRRTANDPQVFSEYLSRCPNNVLITYIYWLVMQIVPDSWPANSATLIMQLLGIVCLDTSIAFTPHVLKRVSPRAANIAFFLFIGTFGLTGHIILVYTDLLTLPLTLGAMYCAVFILFPQKEGDDNYQSWRHWQCYILFAFFGILTYLGYQMKPSSIIITIAFVLVWIIVCWGKALLTKVLPALLAFVIGMIGAGAAFNVAVNKQMQLNYDPSQSYPMSHFMAMGMRDRGGFNYEDRRDMDKYIGKDAKNERSIQLIKQRLRGYGPVKYLQFVLQKARYTLEDGSFSFGREDSLYIYKAQDDHGVLSGFQKTGVAGFMRSMYDGSRIRYEWVVLFQQIAYIVMIVGILVTSLMSLRSIKLRVVERCRSNNSEFISWWLAIAILGSLVFLMLFESGRAKYIIQFMPFYICFAAIGWDVFLGKIKKNNDSLTD